MIRRPPRSTRTAHSFPTRRSSDLYAAHQGPTDGSTILFGSVGPLAIAPHLMSLPYDPVKDLAPITMGANFPNVLVVNSSQIGRAHVELQSLMRISYAVFCLKKKKTQDTQSTKATKHTDIQN